MSATSNDLFKFVSLRKSSGNHSIDPEEIVQGSLVLELLQGYDVSITNPKKEVLERLRPIEPLTEESIHGLALETVAGVVYSDELRTFNDPKALLQLGNDSTSVASFASAPLFRNEYRQVFDSWLLACLRHENDGLVQKYERLLRAGYILWKWARDPDSLRANEVISHLRQARLRLPIAWKSTRHQQAVPQRHAAELTGASKVESSERRKRVQAIKQRYIDLIKLIADHESIRRRIHKQYIAMKQESPNDQDHHEPRKVSGGSPIILTGQFYSDVAIHLTDAQKHVFDNVVSGIPGGNPTNLDDLLVAFDPSQMSDEANALCGELEAIEEAEQDTLPVIQSKETPQDHPLISAIGFGELIVAREQLVGYVAREIAHIENVLPGESKIRKHERINTTEQIEETETISEKETEKDSQTTDRYELQNHSQQAINENFAIQAGVNTSGRYGLTQVNTSLSGSFQQSKSQSRSSSMNVAKEIVSRSVERTFERIHRLRRLTLTEQIRELNRHELKNETNGTDSTPLATSGVYLWVEKIYEVELRHYGTRLMIEFHIPEPALTLLEKGLSTTRRRRLPKFDIGPAGVTAGNYLCLAKRYAATDINPPPAQYIKTGFTWGSAPSEDEEGFAEDTVSDIIAIPDGYRPLLATTIASALKESNSSTTLDVYVAVGGMTAISPYDNTKSFSINETPFNPSLNWPTGVPVSARAHGHWDKTMVVQVSLLCERTWEAFNKWQIQTWEQLRVGYEGLARQLEREQQQEALTRDLLVNFSGRPESENRRLERQELAKWAIKCMRYKEPFDFNAVEQVGDFQEISPPDADAQALKVRFFEDAFEWEQMSYFFDPYYWARRDSWLMRNNADSTDPRFKAFLNAGSARVIVPVTPGYESKVLYYLYSDPEMDERLRINHPPIEEPDNVPSDTVFEDLWVELLTDRKADTALGSGSLSVQKDSDSVLINEDSSWHVSDRDLGRELYIDGERYVITSVKPEREFTLDRAYQGTSNTKAIYATGSVPYGPPWLVNVPTSLVILDQNRERLKSLFSKGE